MAVEEKAMSGVAYTRKEYREMKYAYRLIDDCIAGEERVKASGTRYLPMPNASDLSEENTARYTAYKDRAVFYGVTQRTLAGMTGEVFARDPVAELPTGLDVVVEDADGSGLTLTQLAKRGVRRTLAKGRAGILTDYPMTENGVSKADVESGRVQPTITIYDASQIINWRTKKVGAQTLLTLVVIKEEYDKEDDGFTVTKAYQYRELRLVEGVYTVTIWRESSKFIGPITPTDAKGSTFDYIPFTFIGAENNDADVDHPPMLDIATLNVAHYRNSADYEESCYMVGQPTVAITGLTKEWVDDVLKGQVVLGSRGGLPLPVGGDAKLIQMEANSAPFEAMAHKERQMVALGAKLVEEKQVQRTATEADLENSAETSVLADVAKNVGAAIKFALEQAARFLGVSGTIKYELNTEFKISRMTPQERQQLISEWLQGAVTFSEMREALRKSGVATLDDEEARKEIAADDLLQNDNTDPNDPNDPNNDPNAGN